MLIRISTTQQFENICNIIQALFDEGQNLKEEMKDNSNYFEHLPSSTIHNICDFLDRNDMYNLKSCSISLSLIIFEIMKCIAIGIVNMNGIISNSDGEVGYSVYFVLSELAHQIQPCQGYDR